MHQTSKPWISLSDSFSFLSVLHLYSLLSIPTKIALIMANWSSNILYMVSISAISAAYALFAAVSSYIRCLVKKAWIFFLTDQVLAYLMVTSMAALGEFLYLIYHGDREVSWSKACSSFGKFCTRLKIAFGLHVISVFCFLALAVLSGYRVFRRFDPPFVPSKEGGNERTENPSSVPPLES